MLTVFPRGSGGDPVPDAAAIGADAIWIDLLDPSEGEVARVCRATGRAIPSRADVSEIEHSSRLALEGDLLRLSLPLAQHQATGPATVSPVGFLLSAHCLITVRFTAFVSFTDVAARLAAGTLVAASGPELFVALLEAMTDRLADVLESVGDRLEAISRRIFILEPAAQAPSTQTDRALRETPVQIGQIGGELAKIRDGLLGIARMAPFVMKLGQAIIPPSLAPRLDTVRQDVDSLQNHDAHLADKVQFLLDATLGFINIEQNNIVKVLTVFSIVGIPPTLIAGIYGMNFQNIPELNWTYGYPYAWALMIASALLPLLWMKRRGWI